jgi:hypothetical protein
MDPPRRSYTPSSDRNTFVHLREKSNKGKGPEHSMRRACQTKRTSSVATFLDFTLPGVFGSSVPVTSPLRVTFCYCFFGLVVRTGEEPIEGLLGEYGLVLYYYGVGFLG